MKIASVIITFVLTVATGFGLFFILLLALNGFSERDANPAIYLYIGWSFFCAMILSAAAYFLISFLLKKSFRAIFALLLTVFLTVGTGVILDFGGLIAASILASKVKDSHIKKPAYKENE